MNILVNTLLLSLSINTLVFVVSYLKRTDKLVDITYSFTFISLAVYSLFSTENITTTKIILTILVITWAVRLAWYLMYRKKKIKNETKLTKLSRDFVKGAGFWTMQGLSIWIMSIPFVLFNNKEHLFNNELVIFGLIIWLFGFVTETIADMQKFKFKKKRTNIERWVNIGLWKYSRHPNYFGEILCWIGIYIFTTSSFIGLEFLSIVSPMYTTIFVLFITGIPVLETRYDKKFKGNKKYLIYKKDTSLLVPLHTQIVPVK